MAAAGAYNLSPKNNKKTPKQKSPSSRSLYKNRFVQFHVICPFAKCFFCILFCSALGVYIDKIDILKKKKKKKRIHFLHSLTYLLSSRRAGQRQPGPPGPP